MLSVVLWTESPLKFTFWNHVFNRINVYWSFWLRGPVCGFQVSSRTLHPVEGWECTLALPTIEKGDGTGLTLFSEQLVSCCQQSESSSLSSLALWRRWDCNTSKCSVLAFSLAVVWAGPFPGLWFRAVTWVTVMCPSSSCDHAKTIWERL